MKPWRFDGRTAIVTGAGGNPGLGRAHALLLAERGANIVVNDIGAAPESTHYRDSASAEAVAAEICALGGQAVADTNSVSTLAGATALVATAIEAFGRVDILINNAGLSLAADFTEMTPRDVERHIEVNLYGALWPCRAVWPVMAASGYGRIVNTTSSAIAGLAAMIPYGAAKGGVLALTRGLAVEGEPLGIKVNAVSPGAFTRMVASQQDAESPVVQYLQSHARPEQCSPVAAFLAHEDCPVTGECIDAVGGHVRRTCLMQTAGFADPELSLESLAERWAEVMDGAAEIVPIAAMDTRSWGFNRYGAPA